MVNSALVLISTAVLVAAGMGAADLHVVHVDDSAHPEVEIVVSAPQLVAPDPAGAFRVLDGGAALPVDVSAVTPDAVQVVLLIQPPVLPDGEMAPVRSAVMDVMLRLPPGASVSLVAAAEPPEVVAGPGTGLQARMVAADVLTPGGQPALGEALDLALGQFSYARGTVRSLVVVGDGRGEDIADELAGRLADREVTVHAVQPATDGTARDVDRLVGRLANLYRLTLEVGGQTDEVEVRVSAGGRSAAATVALYAPPDADPPTDDPPDLDRGDAAVDGPGSWSLLFATIAVAGLLLLSAAIVLPSDAAGLRDARPAAGSWEQTAARVAGETGAADAVLEAAARIARERRQTLSGIRAAGLEARVAGAVLALQPLVAGALVVVAGRGQDVDLTAGAWRPAALLVALVLAVAGAVWLRRVARPPFSASPARWQAHDREAVALQDVTETLDVASLYAAGGLALDETLARAGAGEPAEAARRVVEAGDADRASASDVLAAASAGIRSEQVSAAYRQAEAIPVAIAAPFVACTLPAMILVVLAGWLALGSG